MEITVIGSSPSWQDADGACSGYLIEEHDTAVLLDCGNGVFGKLRGRFDHHQIDAVVISHMHADHILDLVPFAYALTYGPNRDSKPPLLALPPGGLAALRSLCGVWGPEGLVEEAFRASEYDPEKPLEFGSMTITFGEVPHFVPAHAMSIVGQSGARFVYGADCGPSASLVRFAENSDLLMLEATFAEGDPSAGAESDSPGHLTGKQAGELAAAAGAKRLLLTHISDERDVEQTRNIAEQAFGGPVEVAGQGSSWKL